MAGVDAVVHFAAETHVDRSNAGADEFLRTNVTGTFTLLEAARAARARPLHRRRHRRGVRQHRHAAPRARSIRSTRPTRTRPPRPPPTSSRAPTGSRTACPCIVTRSSNNFGPYQYPEKVIPLFITNALEDAAAAALRRRQERPRLALRPRQLRGHRSRAPQGQGRRDLQYRRRQRGRERHLTRQILRLRRQAREPHHSGGGPARARPALRARLGQGRARSAGSPRTRSRPRSRPPWRGTGATRPGGGRSSPETSAPTTSGSTRRR